MSRSCIRVGAAIKIDEIEMPVELCEVREFPSLHTDGLVLVPGLRSATRDFGCERNVPRHTLQHCQIFPYGLKFVTLR